MCVCVLEGGLALSTQQARWLRLGSRDFLEPLSPPHQPTYLVPFPSSSSQPPELGQSHLGARKPGFLLLAPPGTLGRVLQWPPLSHVGWKFHYRTRRWVAGAPPNQSP